MELYNEDIYEKTVLDGAMKMCVAAATAPKACGRDTIRTGVLSGAEKDALAAEMEKVNEESGGKKPIFSRDADQVKRSIAVVLVGVKNESRGLNPCGICGHANCAEAKKLGGHCAFDDMDLGIALGSAAAMAADLRLDNRMLYTGGTAAMRLKLLGEEVSTIIAIPVSVSNKNIFFDRK